MSTHLQLDDLEDVLDGEATARALRHLAACPGCRAGLEQQRQARAQLRAALSGLPAPAVPPDLAAQLDLALLRSRERSAPEPTHRARVLVGSAAAVLAVSGGLVLTRPGPEPQVPLASGAVGVVTASAPALAGTAGGDTGSGVADVEDLVPLTHVRTSDVDYSGGDGVVVTGLRALMRAGTATSPRGRTDPLARLHEPAALRSCVTALAQGVPLAVDYARFGAAAALTLVFSSRTHGRVDVVVVGAGCRKGDPERLLTTSEPQPS